MRIKHTHAKCTHAHVLPECLIVFAMISVKVFMGAFKVSLKFQRGSRGHGVCVCVYV